MKNKPNSKPSTFKDYQFNLKFLKFILIIVFGILVVRLYQLQILDGAEYKKKAISNKNQVVRIPAYRGEVFAGKGEGKIVENLPSYSLYMIPKPFYDLRKNEISFNQTLSLIEEKFAIPREGIVKILSKRRYNPFTSVLLKNGLTEEEVFYLAENNEKFPGLAYANSIKRNYIYGEDFAHITGYLQKISVNEYRKRKDKGYYIDSLVGKSGVEAFYDRELRGEEGFKIQTIDVKNRVKGEVESVDNDPIPGHNIFLSVEPRIQGIIAKVMKNYVGGAIVTRVKTGEILGLYSSPTFDPNIFSQRIQGENREKFKALVEADDNPFFNRVVQGEYPPSSIFKLIVAFTALDRPDITFNNTRYFCEGGLRIGGQYFKCTGYHRNQSFASAIANSCNVFFYKLAIRIGPNSIHRGATTFFNLGNLEGIDLNFEKKGRVPSQKWKLEKIGNYWWDGDTANFSIGQGFNLTTILQVNTVTAAIANNGIAYKPHLIRKLYDLENEREIKVEKEELINLPFQPENIRKVQNAMRQVVTWGTAKRIDNKKILIAGKTGTAEVYKNKDTHAWFTGYAPYTENLNAPDDRVAITVLIEQGGFGGVLAATFARAILDGIFLSKDPNLTIKQILQPWTIHSDTYNDWIKRNGEKKLPAEYFAPKKETEATTEEAIVEEVVVEKVVGKEKVEEEPSDSLDVSLDA